MPAIKSGPTNRFAQVDNTFGALRTSPAPLGYGETSANAVGALGHYSVAAASGTIAATLAADALLFALRWTSTTKKCVIYEIEVGLTNLTTFPTDQELRLSVRRGTAYSGASSGGTDLASSIVKGLTGMPTSSVADLRIATTAALTAGTVTAGAPFALAQGTAANENIAAGTATNIQIQPRVLWKADMGDGGYPIVLGASEGLLIRNDVLWGATGTATINVRVRWAEVESFMEVEGD